jgi:hypothetical protein
MKKITIYQDDSIEPIILYDSDYSDISSFSLELSKILKSKEISLLETTSGVLITRPSKIKSILVSTTKTPTEEQDETKKISDEIKQEDVITDGD